MEENKQSIDEMIAQSYDIDKWLLSINLISKTIKNDLFIYGVIIHPKHIKAVEVIINPKEKIVNYELYVSKTIIKKYNYIVKNRNSDNIFKLFTLLMIKYRYGDLNFDIKLLQCVKDRCGKEWNVNVICKNYKEYNPGKNKDE
jgi:hypothetical protein